MAANPMICSICDQRHISKHSTDWCSECEQAFCAECKDFHGLSKALKHHVTIPIADFQAVAPYIAGRESYCTEHDIKYQMFCPTHDDFLCHQCIKKHAECKDIVPIESMIKDAKNSHEFQDTQQSLADIRENIKIVKEILKTNINIVQGEKQSLLSKIRDIRQKINKHLDKIEHSLTSDVCTLENEVVHGCQQLLTTLDDKDREMLKVSQRLDNLVKYATNLQFIIGLKEITSETAQEELYMSSLSNNAVLDEKSIQCYISEKIQHISDELKAFGSVQLTAKPVSLSLLNNKTKRAQLVQTKIIGLAGIKMKLMKTMQTGVTNLTGCSVTPNGKIVLTNCKMSKFKLIVLNSDGSHKAELVLPGAYDVTCIDEDTAAVTTNGFSKVHIIDIVGMRVKHSFDTVGCYGIVYHNDVLVCCVVGKGIQTINMKNKQVKTIVPIDLPSLSHVAVLNDSVYYTNRDTHTVTCCDMEGKHKWEFKDESLLKDPRGVTVDNSGNVYVAGMTSKNVVIVSPDGKQSRQILSSDDGLTTPRGLHYDKTRNHLLSTNGKFTLVFEVSK